MIDEGFIEDIIENIEEVKDVFDQRIKTWDGYIISSVANPNIQGLDDSQLFGVFKASSQIQNNQYLLCLDPLTQEEIATKVVGDILYDLDTQSLYNNVITLEDENPLNYLSDTNKVSELALPKIKQMEGILTFDLLGKKLGPLGYAPSVRSILYQPNIEQIKNIIYRDRITEPEGYFNLGVLSLNNTPYTVDEEFVPIRMPIKLLNQHLSINGQSGVGKTSFLKTCIFNLYQNDFAVLATDTQGDLTPQLWRETNTSENQEILNSEVQTGIYSALGYNSENIGIPKENVTIFIPPQDLVNNDDLRDIDPLLNLAVNDPDVNVEELSFTSAMIRTSLELITSISNPSSAQIEIINFAFQNYIDQNQEFNLEDFRDNIEIYAPEGSARSIPAIRRKLSNLIDLRVFDTQETQTTQYEDLIQSGQISVVYLPVNNPRINQIKTAIELLIFQLITRETYDRENPRRAIVIDEAQDLIPSGKGSLQSSHLADLLAYRFEQLALQGRKFGISLTVSSQQPKKIHPTVFDQCSTRVFFRLSQNDIPLIKEYVPSNYRNRLTKYKKGICLISSPELFEDEAIEVITPYPPIFHADPRIILENIMDDEDEENSPEDDEDFNPYTDSV